MAVLTITAQNFEQEVLQSDKPVLIDFYADWCGPCKMMAPVIEEIAGEVNDVKVGKLNIDNEMEIAQKYGVMSIPTLIVYREGEEVTRRVGVQSLDQLEVMLGVN